jgi:hypothetical protein
MLDLVEMLGLDRLLADAGIAYTPPTNFERLFEPVRRRDEA